MVRKNSERIILKETKDYRAIMLEGASRELVAAKIFLDNDFMVSFPVADDRYDLIIEKYPYYFRIQVKPLNQKYKRDPEYSTSLDAWEINAFTRPKGTKKTYSENDVDFIMGIELETSNYAIIPIEEVPNSGVIRFSEKTERWHYFKSMHAVLDKVM